MDHRTCGGKLHDWRHIGTPSHVRRCGTHKQRANEVGPVFPGFDMFTQVFQAGGSRALQATGFGSGMTLLQCLAEG